MTDSIFLPPGAHEFNPAQLQSPLSSTVLAEAVYHARDESPLESCGLVIEVDGVQKYRPCLNLSATPKDTFKISAQDFAGAEDTGKLVCYVHSHASGIGTPSHRDLQTIKGANLDSLIVTPAGFYTYTPAILTTALYLREFHHATADCFAFARSYFLQELGVLLKAKTYASDWWATGSDLLSPECFSDWGFNPVQSIAEIAPNDVLSFKVGARVANHIAVFLGDTQIAHHAYNRLSCKEQYSGFWQNRLVGAYRHRSTL